MSPVLIERENSKLKKTKQTKNPNSVTNKVISSLAKADASIQTKLEPRTLLKDARGGASFVSRTEAVEAGGSWGPLAGQPMRPQAN